MNITLVIIITGIISKHVIIIPKIEKKGLFEKKCCYKSLLDVKISNNRIYYPITNPFNKQGITIAANGGYLVIYFFKAIKYLWLNLLKSIIFNFNNN